jgi:hypothetical protein
MVQRIFHTSRSALVVIARCNSKPQLHRAVSFESVDVDDETGEVMSALGAETWPNPALEGFLKDSTWSDNQYLE